MRRGAGDAGVASTSAALALWMRWQGWQATGARRCQWSGASRGSVFRAAVRAARTTFFDSPRIATALAKTDLAGTTASATSRATSGL